MKSKAHGKRLGRRNAALGPSLYEVEYLRQLREELEIFLKSRSFSTIRGFHIDFEGTGYQGSMDVKAS